MGDAVSTRPRLMSAGVSIGATSSIWAPTLAAIGDAKEVPSTCWYSVEMYFCRLMRSPMTRLRAAILSRSPGVESVFRSEKPCSALSSS